MRAAFLGLTLPLTSVVLSGTSGWARQSGDSHHGAGSPGVVCAEFICEQSPTPASHASTIVETAQGLAAAWFGGTRERAADVSMWLARHDGNRWSAPERVATGRMRDGTPCPYWNPVLYKLHGPSHSRWPVGGVTARWQAGTGAHRLVGKRLHGTEYPE